MGSAIYYPLGCHEQSVLKHLGYKLGDFPLTEAAARETLVIPIFSELTEEQKHTVVDVVAEFFGA